MRDFTDTKKRQIFKTKFNNLFSLLASHAENEDRYINPLLEEIKSQQFDIVKIEHEKLEDFSLSLKKDLENLLHKNELNEKELNAFYLKFVQFQSS